MVTHLPLQGRRPQLEEQGRRPGGLGHRKLQPSGDRGDGLGGGPGATASVALGLRAAAQRGHERRPRLGD